jgi:hypothetical protein
MARTIVKRSNFLPPNTISICFFLLIIFIILYYCLSRDRLSFGSFQFFDSLESSLTPNSSNQCDLSLKESDGWFCELNLDWKYRKTLHHRQDKRNRVNDSRPLFFQNNWEPTIQCEFEQRLGNSGEGGKWLCDIRRFESMNYGKILIYSLGSHGDFSFERAVKQELPNAEIHTFDMNIYKCPDDICIFHQARLGDGKMKDSKSLLMVINELGHQKRNLDILKVDIEGSEFNLFEELFQSSTNNLTDIPYIRQILIEIHLGGGATNEETSRRTHRLFELFRLNNYAIFHKEVNLDDPRNVFEYALIRLNPAFLISPI